MFADLKKKFQGFFKSSSKPKTKSIGGSRKRRTILTERAGRGVRTVGYRRGENTLAPLQTLVNAISNGRYDLSTRRFSVSANDFVGWERMERQSLTLVLLVDVSRSTFPFIYVFTKIINSLTAYFKMHQDRIGLISLQGTQAKILNHPTHNYHVVTKSLLQLSIQGETPLADGLQKALAMVKLDKYRKPGSSSLVILLSDCYPEPLTGKHKDLFDEPAYRETLRAATLCRKSRVPLLVINTSFKNRDEKKYLPGEKLSCLIARESGGKLVKVFRSHKSPMEAESVVQPSDVDINLIMSGIEDMLLGGTLMSENKQMKQPLFF